MVIFYIGILYNAVTYSVGSESIEKENIITLLFTTVTGQEAALSVAAATQSGQQDFAIEGTRLKGICIENGLVCFLQCIYRKYVLPILVVVKCESLCKIPKYVCTFP